MASIKNTLILFFGKELKPARLKLSGQGEVKNKI
jgi:hypothetical protein